MGLAQVMTGLRTKKALFETAAASSEGGAVAWEITVRRRDGAVSTLSRFGPSRLAAEAWALSQPGVAGIVSSRGLTLDCLKKRLDAEEAAVAAGAEGGAS